MLELIIDRTQEDVDRVKYLREKIYSKTASEQELIEWDSDLKGAYNASDFNRVSNAMQFLVDLLNEIGYNINIEVKTDRSDKDYIDVKDFEKYLQTVERLRSTLSLRRSTPNTPTFDNFDFKKANDIEKILVEIEDIISLIKCNWLYCGEVSSGEV